MSSSVVCRAVGIDPSSLSTGLVILEGNNKSEYLYARSAKTISCPSLFGMDRYREIVRQIMEAIHAHKVDRVVVEGYSLNLKNASSVVPLVELGGLLRFMLYLDEFVWLAPRAGQLKQFVTGKGNAPKDAMMMWVHKRWGYTSPNNNVADAYGLACIGLCHMNALPNPTKEMRSLVGQLKLISK